MVHAIDSTIDLHGDSVAASPTAQPIYNSTESPSPEPLNYSSTPGMAKAPSPEPFKSTEAPTMDDADFSQVSAPSPSPSNVPANAPSPQDSSPDWLKRKTSP